MPPEWKPPAHWQVIRTIDAHAAGEPLRIVVEGLPPIPGATMLEKRRYAREHLDDLRTTLLWEPRGHADMYGCFVTEPVSPDSHFGVLFLHNEGFSTMCGHGIIALVTAMLETGLIEDMAEGRRKKATEKASGKEVVPEKMGWGKGKLSPLKIDTPAGQVKATAEVAEDRVKSVSFLNVPSFVFASDRELNLPGLQRIRYDVAFGGAFYAFCRAEDLGLRLVPEEFGRLIEIGMKIKRAVAQELPVRHPFDPDLSFLYGTIFVGKPTDPHHHSRNVCVFAEGEVDRSPTGTGLSARAALHFSKGELKIGDSFAVESLIGTCFRGRLVEKTWFGPYEAIIPEITGEAYITGRNEILIDPQDPLGRGFLLRSINS